tara:strand:+ start:184 stop:648 length:465 start_codon:yes stop_codon:yes gene_type:complete
MIFRLSVIILLLSSCSAQYHLNKAIKKGYKCEETGDTIRITTLDSIPVIINDTIFWEKIINTKDTIIKYNTVYVPKTRQDKRIEYKIQVKTIYKDRLVYKYKYRADGQKSKSEVKIAKAQRPRANGNLSLLFVGVGIGLLLSYLFKFARERYMF